MQFKPWFFGLVFSLLLVGTTQATAEEAGYEPGTYKVEPGDVLTVSVWKEEGLLQEVLVRPDGGISFPLAGNIQAQGKTLEQIESIISQRLADYIADPVVTVSAKQLFGNKVYVIGKVNKPGEYPINRPTDVMQGLAMAAGMTPFSAVNDIVILRRHADGQQEAIPFRYGDVEDGDDLHQNIVLQPGDVIVVP
ncbi:polysaccharide biosynthesis/export family protein [Methylicorpusculum oleiharenae]|uniref:polysaccharide biosynthesis/export family protein n=1 Tax=Methylicorpusculum oleiharenae TaxID=1338687 RepID=UPI0019D16D9D|nr:polysaccharide biosynthesis/export family protein [Methylicorpusculum oleiharenae]MCD2450685.1 polysaccharide biosynthesis/export family protein [Methylicorpusculum oleiharenae]